MGKYRENISDHSLWMTATPTPLAKTLPFFVSEAGHFMAGLDYRVQRETHDSFLLLYTVGGQGSVQTGDDVLLLPRGHSVIIDCRISHEYHAVSAQWEFLWIHFNGSGVAPLLDVVYPEKAVHAVAMKSREKFEAKLNGLINEVSQSGLAAYLHLSSGLHLVMNDVCASALENEKVAMKHDSTDDVRAVMEYIENNYFNPITLEDMIRDIHVSKYHFIRRFSRVMGITPYSFLTNYRINVSKTLLRSTDKTVAEIAEACGFLDTSNFIAHFKKHTGQKPLQYRRDFS